MGWNAESPSAWAPPEADLSYLGSRAELREEHQQAFDEALERDLDWRALFTHAASHGVLPLLSHHLLARPERVPEEFLERLRERQQLHAASSLMKFRELDRITQSFAADGIATVHFKGPILAARAYRNLSLRDFVDFDILIHPEDARRARDRLHADGYESTLSAEGEAHHLAKSYWLGFAHREQPFKVDLHWKLADPFFRYEPDLDRLWRNVQTVETFGISVQTFGAEDSVLALAAHGFKHAYSRLKWIADLGHWIAAHPDLDWDSVLETAAELHVRRILAVSLLLVARWDGTCVPAAVLEDLGRDAKSHVLAGEIWATIFLGARPIEGLRAELFHARGRERRLDGLSYLWFQCRRRFKKAVVPNELDRAFLPLPPGLGCLHYLVRPVRLLFGRQRDSNTE